MNSPETNLDEPVTPQELMALSREVFGQDNYGQLAIDIIERVRREAWISVRLSDTRYIDTEKVVDPELRASGLSHNSYHDTNSLWEELLTGKAARTADSETVEKLLREAMKDKDQFFDYEFVVNERARLYDTVAFMIPRTMDKWALARYMSRRSHAWKSLNPANGELSPLYEHHLHGAIGRALDLLSLLSGVVDDIDPDKTADTDGFISYAELRSGLLKDRATPTDRAYFHTAMTNAVGWQAHHGVWYEPFEVAVEGGVRLERKSHKIDQIAISSLKTFGERTGRKSLKAALSEI